MSKGHGSSVERRGVKDILDGVDLAILDDAKYYMLWQGSTPKYTYEGDDMEGIGKQLLSDMLMAAAAQGNRALYTLRFYRHLGKNESIDSATPFFASFNFKLNDDAYMMPGNNIPLPSVSGFENHQTQAIIGAIDRLNQRIDQMEQEEEEEPETMMERVGKFVTSPGAEQIMSGIAGLFNRFFMSKQQYSRPAGPGISGISQQEYQKEQYEKAIAALNRLAAVQPDFGDHLTLLAELAENNPNKYNMGLAFLK
jgi:hypothetical protein